MDRRISLLAILLPVISFATIWMLHGFHTPALRYFRFLDAYENLVFINDGSSNFLNSRNLYLFFHGLLLTGGLLYQVSKFRESRLLRFAISILFISKVVNVLQHLIWAFTHNTSFGDIQATAIWILFQAVQLVWIYISYIIIKYFNKKKALAVISDGQIDGAPSEFLVSASLWQRLFHLIVDTIVAVLVFSSVFHVLIRYEAVQKFLMSLQSITGERGALLVVIATFRFVYYVIFETTFGVTSAKLLTETRVIYNNGTAIPMRAVIIRTLSRFVPFEALSFFGSNGWHDRWSDTYVVREARTGVKGGLYFLILPLILVIAIIFSYGYF